jgi:hypothetical protein
MGWMTQKLVKAEAKSQSGGYHTIFRGVKQVTFEIDDKFVMFSTISLTAEIKMPANQRGLCTF